MNEKFSTSRKSRMEKCSSHPGGEILDVDNVEYFDFYKIRLYGGSHDGSTFTIDEVEIID